jgi:hypothetical protein
MLIGFHFYYGNHDYQNSTRISPMWTDEREVDQRLINSAAAAMVEVIDFTTD